MSPSKVLTLMAALMAIVCVVAAGVYFYKQERDVAVDGGKTPPIAATPSPSEQAAKPEAPPIPQARPEAGSGEPEAPQAAKLPSFDVILVEPGGEGVIAGRAEPGWQVSVESGGRTVARVVADANGEWSIALKEPLPPGDHALSLSAQSPDGKQALESAKSESIAVAPAKDKKTATAPAGDLQKPGEPAEEAVPGDNGLIAPKAPEMATMEAPQTEEEIPGDKSLIEPKAAEAALAEPSQPETQAADEVPGDKSLIAPQGEERHAAVEPSAAPESEEQGEVPGDRSLVEPGAPKTSRGPQAPPVKIRTVDYADLAPGMGRMTLDGTSPPGSTVYLYFDDERLAEVTAGADGKWQFEIEKVLPSGHHQFRAEWYDEATGVLAGRTIVAVERVKPAPEFAAKEDEPLAVAPVSPESEPADGEIPGDKSLIAPKSAEVALAEPAAPESSPARAADEEEIPGDKSLIAPKAPAESAKVESAQEPTAQAGSSPQGETILGDKSLIAPDASETTVAETSEPEPQGSEDVPGDKGLIAPEASEKAAQIPATADESSGGIPGDKSLIEPKPSEQTAVAEASEAADQEAKPTVQAESPAQDEAIPGDRSLIEASPQMPAGPAGEGSTPAVKSLLEPPGKEEPDSGNVASKSEGEGEVPGDKSLIQSPDEKKPGERVAASESAASAETAASEAAPAPDVSKGDEKPDEKTVAAATGPMIVRERRTEIYWIKRGDTLWDLAEQYLDAGWRYKRIYRTNSDIIRNPHWIYPDQVLVIPEP
jgi:nucleoid-associated protein YgaU